MSVKEILSYRNKCLICQQNLQLKALDITDIKYKFGDNHLTLVADDQPTCSVTFKSDNTFTMGNKWEAKYMQPFKSEKACRSCKPFDPHYELYGYGYRFSLWGEEHSNEYTGLITSEFAKFAIGNEVYHIKNDFLTSSCNIYLSRVGSTKSLRTLRGEGNSINIPAIDLSKIKCIEDLYNKIKTYIIFS